MTPRLYDVRTACTPYGYCAWCVQHTVIAVHPDRDRAVGVVLLAIVLSNLTQPRLTPLAFRFSHRVD